MSAGFADEHQILAATLRDNPWLGLHKIAEQVDSGAMKWWEARDMIESWALKSPNAHLAVTFGQQVPARTKSRGALRGYLRSSLPALIKYPLAQAAGKRLGKNVRNGLFDFAALVQRGQLPLKEAVEIIYSFAVRDLNRGWKIVRWSRVESKNIDPKGRWIARTELSKALLERLERPLSRMLEERAYHTMLRSMNDETLGVYFGMTAFAKLAVVEVHSIPHTVNLVRSFALANRQVIHELTRLAKAQLEDPGMKRSFSDDDLKKEAQRERKRRHDFYAALWNELRHHTEPHLPMSEGREVFVPNPPRINPVGRLKRAPDPLQGSLFS